MNEMEKSVDRVVLAGASLCGGGPYDTDDATMEELAQLVYSAGGEVAGSMIQNIKTIDTRTYIGSGKVKELREFIDINDVNMAVFDNELSGSVTRNLEEALGVTVIDRSRLILDIFARHATTKEGKCQVELAQLKYILPRLSGVGASLSRLAGGIGTRGPGESKLESDRRHLRRRIDHLSRELKEIERHRENLRKQRQKEAVPIAALIGYTNVGKSSLLNLLTGVNDAYVENKLFATLDPLMRRCELNDKNEVIVSDTVGFISKLPHHLIEAFKSTLDEVRYADVILHVADASSPNLEREMQVVENLLLEMGITDKPIIKVFNKCDIAKPPEYLETADSINISVKNNINIKELKALIEKNLSHLKRRVTVLIPYDMGRHLGYIYKNAGVLSEESTEEGTRITAICDAQAYHKIREYEV